MAQNYGNAYPQQTYPQQAPPNAFAQPPNTYAQPEYAPPPAQQPNYYQNPSQGATAQAVLQPAADLIPLTPEEQAQIALLRKYAHILPLRMFPLDIYNHQKDEAYRAELLAEIQKSQAPTLNPAQKVALHAVGAATGTTFVTMDGMVNTLMKGALLLDTLGSRPTQHIEMSRWASPPGSACASIIVDVWEECSVGKEDAFAMFTVRVNREATIKIVDKKKTEEKIRTKKIKANKAFDKYVYKRITDMYVVEAKGEVKLEKVLVTMKVMGVTESGNMRQQFKKHWIMP
ncbi:hypothetical protein K458DRAFT_411565 [Lentithecium fluviatile CBS 122367]|uniref:Uncharacterized protein n=1 Tax=Lentithecium fluviatile CBS 122367 TaxID=1168545 RepID=A0A6G1JP16_9PLEO|nr:hypothetical protein K458DRAFT_411565 [Lentithecium fluviatile CBS 122367]